MMTPAEVRPYFRWLKLGSVIFVVCFGVLGRSYGQIHHDGFQWVFLELVLALVGCGLIAYGFTFLHEKRLLENLPESRVRSVAMGVAELVGAAQQKAPLVSPITGLPCVYYRYTIEEERSDSKGRTHWEIVDQGRSDKPFYLEDETGKILVEPAGAETILREGYRKVERKSGWGSNRIRTIEWRIIPQERICVLGTVSKTRDEIWARKATLHERLQQLKSNPEQLKQFDRDGDGQIDAEEWDAAVQATKDAILKEEVGQPQPPPEDEVAIGKGTDEKTFVIADRSEQSIARGLGLKAGAALVFGPLIVVLVALSILSRAGLLPGGFVIPWARILG